MKSALITGGAGFIGSHLAELLIKKKYKVTIIDNLSKGKVSNLKRIRKDIIFIKYDISKNKRNILLKKNYDFIFHLAALTNVQESFLKPKKYKNINFLATKSFFKKINLNKTKKIIYAASASCYGNTSNKLISEKNKIMPISPYAKSKYSSENFLKVYSKKRKIDFVSLRLFNVYGPKSQTNSYAGVIDNFIKSYFKKENLKIYSDGKQTRSFVYVLDVARAFVNVCESEVKNEVFNIGSSKSITINSLANYFNLGKTFFPKKKGDIRFSQSKITKIFQYIGWKPKINLKKGLKLTIAYKKKYD